MTDEQQQEVDELDQLDLLTGEKVKPKFAACKYCHGMIEWVKDGDGRMMPYEENGERHKCQEYILQKRMEKKNGDDVFLRAKALHDALVNMFPGLHNEK